jgi:dihydrofolate synthase
MLGDFVNKMRTEKPVPVVWIVAFSEGRDIRSCLSKFVKKNDFVACVEFGPVDGMPWVKPVPVKKIAEQATVFTHDSEKVVTFEQNLVEAIRWGINQTKECRGMLAAAGSLYLVSDIHRLRRGSDSDSESESDQE